MTQLCKDSALRMKLNLPIINRDFLRSIDDVWIWAMSKRMNNLGLALGISISFIFYICIRILLCPQHAELMTHVLAFLTLSRHDFARSVCARMRGSPALGARPPVAALVTLALGSRGEVGHLNRFLHNPPILTKDSAQKVHLVLDNYVIKS